MQAQPDGAEFISNTPPTHAEGRVTLDGIPWAMVQPEPVYTAGVRHVTFRDIVLRTGHSIVAEKVFAATILATDHGLVTVESDLPGLTPARRTRMHTPPPRRLR